MIEMTVQNAIHTMGIIGGVFMPFWNIPLILHILKRKNSNDISLAWLLGVWGCILLMLPSTLVSPDLVLKAYGISNALLFTCVVVVVLMNRKDSEKGIIEKN
jgi:uncharacterized protein with PQ loop repeat